MTFLEIIGAAMVLLSIYFYGKVSIWGPVLGVTSAIALGVVSIYVDLWFILGMNVVVAIFHLKNLLNWSRNAPEHYCPSGQETVR